MYSKFVFGEEIDAYLVNYNSFEEMLLQCGIESSDDRYDFDALYLEDILDIYDQTLYIVHLALKLFKIHKLLKNQFLVDYTIICFCIMEE